MPACDLSMRRKAGILTAALVAAVFLWLLFTLPPRPAIAAGVVPDAIKANTIAPSVLPCQRHTSHFEKSFSIANKDKCSANIESGIKA